MGDLPFTRKQLVMISGGFGIVIVLMGIWAYFATHQYLTITYDASIYKSVVLYQGTESSSEKTIAPTKTVVEKKIESGKTYHLSKGSYYLIASGDGVSTNMQGILLKDRVARTLDYELSDKRLAELSKSEKSNIDNAIHTHNRSISAIYNIASETVTEKGDWAIAALVFKGSATDLNRDTQKVILQKKNNHWQVACAIQISISKYECPQAPQAVLERADTIDIRTQTPLMPGYTIYESRDLEGADVDTDEPTPRRTTK